MSTRPRRLLLPLALAAATLLAASSASQAVNIVLQPPYNVVNAVGVAPAAAPQLFNAGGIQFACTPTITFRVNVPAVAGAAIGNLIPMLHITAVNYAACPAGVAVASLNNAANPIVVGQLTAVTPGAPGTVLYVALNVRVRVTIGAAMSCLFTGRMGLRILANGTILLLGANLVATPVAGDTCDAGLAGAFGQTTYTPGPALFANVI